MRKTDLEPSARRIYRSMLALAGIGTLGALILRGAPSGTGFLLGSLFSMLNFWTWHRLVRHVGASAPEAGGRGPVILFAARYFVFLLAGYVILNYFEASIIAVLAGCFIAVAAVILEILFELTYGI